VEAVETDKQDMQGKRVQNLAGSVVPIFDLHFSVKNRASPASDRDFPVKGRGVPVRKRGSPIRSREARFLIRASPKVSGASRSENSS
jgi:hypothetical protein